MNGPGNGVLLFSAFASGAYAGYNAVSGSNVSSTFIAVNATAVWVGPHPVVTLTSLAACAGAMAGAAAAVSTNMTCSCSLRNS